MNKYKHKKESKKDMAGKSSHAVPEEKSSGAFTFIYVIINF